MAVKEREFERTNLGLPRIAFAIEGDKDNPASWKLPHHTRAIFHRGKLYLDETVDWHLTLASVAAISPAGYQGKRVEATAEEILQAARHLAEHFRAAGEPIPNILSAII